MSSLCGEWNVVFLSTSAKYMRAENWKLVRIRF